MTLRSLCHELLDHEQHECEHFDVCVNRSDDNLLDDNFQVSTPQQCDKEIDNFANRADQHSARRVRSWLQQCKMRKVKHTQRFSIEGWLHLRRDMLFFSASFRTLDTQSEKDTKLQRCSWPRAHLIPTLLVTTVEKPRSRECPQDPGEQMLCHEKLRFSSKAANHVCRIQTRRENQVPTKNREKQDQRLSGHSSGA